MDPNSAKTLVDQMRAVSSQFLGIVPAGSYYFYKNTVWIVTGQIDQATGELVLQGVNGGTTLLNTITQLYPSAVAAPVLAAPLAAATGATHIGSTLLSV